MGCPGAYHPLVGTSTDARDRIEATIAFMFGMPPEAAKTTGTGVVATLVSPILIRRHAGEMSLAPTVRLPATRSRQPLLYFSPTANSYPPCSGLSGTSRNSARQR